MDVPGSLEIRLDECFYLGRLCACLAFQFASGYGQEQLLEDVGR